VQNIISRFDYQFAAHQVLALPPTVAERIGKAANAPCRTRAKSMGPRARAAVKRVSDDLTCRMSESHVEEDEEGAEQQADNERASVRFESDVPPKRRQIKFMSFLSHHKRRTVATPLALL
jgi:hypothetical protein